jgi:ribosome recycling factor
VRNVRRDGMDQLKKLEKEHSISEDQHRKLSDELQKLTDESIHEIDGILSGKEQEIMHV